MAQITIGEAGFDITKMVVISTAGEINTDPDTATFVDVPYTGGVARFGIDSPAGSTVVSLDVVAGDDAATGQVLLSAIGLAIVGNDVGDALGNKDDAQFLTLLLSGDDGIQGGPSDDLLLGQLGNDIVRGNDGNDLVGGGVGNDRLEGGNGNDGVDGGDGNDLLLGGAGNDRMVADDGSDFVFGEDGDDLIGGGAGDDFLGGGDGNDILDGSDHGNDGMSGGTGADTLALGKGNDTAAGGDGADIFVLRVGAGVLEADTVSDLVFADGDRLRNDTGVELATLLATATEVDDGTRLTLGTDDTVFIVGVTAINADFFV